MSLNRVRAVFGISMTKVVEVIALAQGMHDGMADDTTTYAAPTLPLPAFLTLIQNTSSAQAAVRTRVIGAAEKRDIQRALLVGGMETELLFVQQLADANPAHAASLIRNAGLSVAAITSHNKPLLALTLGASGSVNCVANIRLLVGVGTKKPTQHRCINWEYTLDGKTFVSALSTPGGKTTLQNLPLLTVVGVRVSMTNSAGQGPWSQVVSILVH
jgi:hypothetical protein